MFIIERPYVSEYLIDTIINHDWAVLYNETIEDCSMEDGAFRLWSSKKATDNYLKQEYPLIYSNSENAIGWVLKNLPRSNISNYIRIFKNKFEFREKLKELYPNFYYETVKYEDINYVEKSDFQFPLVIKPSVGFFGFGVYIIKKLSEWDNTIKNLHKEIYKSNSLYQMDVVNTTDFLIEQWVEGDEYSIDAYYDRNGTPVILNIFNSIHQNENDIKNRLFITSASIVIEHMARFAQILRDLGDLANIKNFPINLEIKITKDGNIIPIEVNPMRFSGWCSADIAKYAWGFNVYECFNAQIYPDWNEILEKASKNIYYFSLLEIPPDISNSSIRNFDFNACLAHYPNIIELRRVNYKVNRLFGIVFGYTDSEEDLQRILALDIHKYIS